jgi:hypothetical protein
MENYSPKMALKAFKIIHLALMSIPIFFGFVVSYLVLVEQMGDPAGVEFLLYLPSIFLIIAFPLSNILYKNMLNTSLKQDDPFRKRMGVLQGAHLIRMSLFEMSALFAGVACLITGSIHNLAVIGVVILIFLKHMPSGIYLETEIGLRPEEKSALQ